MDSRPIHSQFDTTLGFVQFNVPAPGLAELGDVLVEADRRRRDSAAAREEYLGLIQGYVSLHHYPLVAHEESHALQAITYPALYVRCLREMTMMSAVFDDLRKAPGAVPVPIKVPDWWLEMIGIPTRKLRIEVTGRGKLMAKRVEPGWPQANDVSETDLLEGSTSIFQYKAEIGGDGTVGGFRRWLAETGRNRRVFDFLSGLMSPADAYVSLPCLVMAAHLTDQPFRGFMYLVEKTPKDGAERPGEIGTDSYWTFLVELVQRSTAVIDLSNPQPPSDDGPLFRFDRSTMLGLAQETGLHPLTPIVELAWGEEANIRRLQEAMLHPSQAFNRDRRDAEDWLEPFRAPATAYRILDERLEVGGTVFKVSQTLLERNRYSSKEQLIGLLLQLMRVKAFVFAAATPFFRGTGHNCPHLKCEYHRFDLCHRWMNIPPRHDECEFPQWLSELTNHDLDLNSGILVPAAKRKDAHG